MNDAQLIALCRKHGLSGISVGPRIDVIYDGVNLGTYFDATVFWASDGTRCRSAHGETSEAAVMAAIECAARPVLAVVA